MSEESLNGASLSGASLSGASTSVTPTPNRLVIGMLVAAGAGTRLGGPVPKALRLLTGQPLVRRAASALVAGGCTHLVVVTAPGLAEEFDEALRGIEAELCWVEGGARRQDSVLAGLLAIQADADLRVARVVLVHDAARALVPPSVVGRVIEAVEQGHPAVVPVVPVIDSLREVHDADRSAVVDRARFRAVQTPQGFDLPLLVEAHQFTQSQGLEVTDDAATMEALGHPVHLVEGHRDAMKVTETIDLVVAEALLDLRTTDELRAAHDQRTDDDLHTEGQEA